MTPLPIIRGASAALYPLTQTFLCRTGKFDGDNGKATRWVRGYPSVRFATSSTAILRSEKETLKNFFAAAAGEFATDLSITTDQAYTNLSFDSDEFTGVEQQSKQYFVQWSLTQTLTQNLAPGSPGGAFPPLANGAIGQRPFTQRLRFDTRKNVMDMGPKYTFKRYAAGFNGYPTGGLKAWDFEERSLSAADVAIRIGHFLANWGDAMPFDFTDEDGTTYHNVYYASPDLAIQWAHFNSAAIHTALVQMQ